MKAPDLLESRKKHERENFTSKCYRLLEAGKPSPQKVELEMTFKGQ